MNFLSKTRQLSGKKTKDRFVVSGVKCSSERVLGEHNNFFQGGVVLPRQWLGASVVTLLDFGF